MNGSDTCVSEPFILINLALLKIKMTQYTF